MGHALTVNEPEYWDQAYDRGEDGWERPGVARPRHPPPCPPALTISKLRSSSLA